MPLALMTEWRGGHDGYRSNATPQNDTLDRCAHSSTSRRDRLSALSRFLCGLASGMTSTKRRTFNVAAVFAVLLGSLAAGAFGGIVVWAFCEFGHDMRYGPSEWRSLK
jgi:hypothetical protein